jgi:hypothetical protein
MSGQGGRRAPAQREAAGNTGPAPTFEGLDEATIPQPGQLEDCCMNCGATEPAIWRLLGDQAQALGVERTDTLTTGGWPTKSGPCCPERQDG